MMAMTGPESESRASPGLETGCTANPTTATHGCTAPDGSSIRQPGGRGVGSGQSDDLAPSHTLRRRRDPARRVVLLSGIYVAGAEPASRAAGRHRHCAGAEPRHKRADSGEAAEGAARGGPPPAAAHQESF